MANYWILITCSESCKAANNNNNILGKYVFSFDDKNISVVYIGEGVCILMPTLHIL